MPTETAKPVRRSPILVDLALQGGGSHGAFAWGVLDRLLEEPWLEIDGISGTSAGAMNAAVLVDGFAKGGALGAREALATFWRKISEAARFSPLRRGPLDVLLGRWTLNSSPVYVGLDLLSRLVSPYDLNPLGKNPLRDILSGLIDFKQLAQAPIKLFITATNVRTGRGHVFKNNAITPTSCSPLPVCRRCFRRSKLTVNPIGTAAIPATRHSRPSYGSANRTTPFSSDQPGRAPGNATLRLRYLESSE